MTLALEEMRCANRVVFLDIFNLLLIYTPFSNRVGSNVY